MVSAAAVLDMLERPGEQPAAEALTSSSSELPWRGLFWLVPAETRLGVAELCEALGRPRSWIYRRTSEKAQAEADGPPLPRRKLDGELVFVTGEIRAWLRQIEEVIVAGPMESTAVERRLFAPFKGGA